MKKLILLITAILLMIPALALANYRITYVEYFTPDKPGPLHQRIKVIEVSKIYTWFGVVSVVSFTDTKGNKGCIKSPYIKIEEVDKGD